MLVRAEGNLADEAPQTIRLETLDDVVAQVMARQGVVRLSGLRGAARGIVAAQVLLTLGDTEERRRYLNARNTLLALLELRVIPIVNENDVIAQVSHDGL